MNLTDADRERDERHSILLQAAETALTTAERKQFLDRFPQQRGAHVADILDILDDTDSNIEVIEQIAEQFGDRVPEPGLLSMAVHIANSIDYQALFMRPWETLEPIIERIRPLLVGWSAMELIEERAKRDKLEVLAPLGFEDFGDAEFPHAIWHKLIGDFDHRKVTLENVVSVAFHAGKDAGANELAAKARALFGAAPSNHTHPREGDGQ